MHEHAVNTHAASKQKHTRCFISWGWRTSSTQVLPQDTIGHMQSQEMDTN
jgi:hypothetical protein